MSALWAGLFAFPSAADFLPPYTIADFTLFNSPNADGFAETPDAGLTLVVTGPNDGSGLAGYTEFTTVIKASAVLQFRYTYRTLDAPGRDSASYVLNGVVHQLATADGQTGQITVSVRTGDRFGFRIDTTDNIGEPGVLTIGSFSPTVATVPALSGPMILLLALSLCGLGWSLGRSPATTSR